MALLSLQGLGAPESCRIVISALTLQFLHERPAASALFFLPPGY